LQERTLNIGSSLGIFVLLLPVLIESSPATPEPPVASLRVIQSRIYSFPAYAGRARYFYKYVSPIVTHLGYEIKKVFIKTFSGPVLVFCVV
jgi:hypothetical protein